MMGAFMAIYEPLAFSFPGQATSRPTILKSSMYEDHHHLHHRLQSSSSSSSTSLSFESSNLLQDGSARVIGAASLPANLQTTFIPPSTGGGVGGAGGGGVDVHESGLFWIKRELELQILSDLLFVFQGINGRHIKYFPRNESYGIDQQMKASIPAPVRDIVLGLCEVGWLFEKISRYMTKIQSSEAIGLISQYR
jgi:hypothetical protein